MEHNERENEYRPGKAAQRYFERDMDGIPNGGQSEGFVRFVSDITFKLYMVSLFRIQTRLHLSKCQYRR